MCESFGYIAVLNIPLVLNMPELWIYQSSEYVRVTQGSEYAWIIPEYVWICLIMPGYVWTCWNMHWICLNLPEWLLFYISPFPHLFYNPFSTWTRGYLLEHLEETRGYSLKKHEAVFLKKKNLIFSLAAGSNSFVFCFKLNSFASKI